MTNPVSLKTNSWQEETGVAKVKPFLLRNFLSRRDRGFTLIEMIVVVLMIAILSAIAAPGWLTFVNRQRVSKVNDVVLSSLQEAQREAKRTKQKYSVSFRMDNNNPQVAVHLFGTDITSPNYNGWKSLTSDVGVNPNQIWVGTNLTQNNSSSNHKPDNIAGNSVSILNTNIKTITFDQFGNMPDVDPNTQLNANANVNDDSTDEGLMVVVAVPNNNNPISETKRCSVVITVLGSIRIGKGEYNATSNPQGCL